MVKVEKRKLKMTFEVNTALPIEAIKEYIAMTLEKYGDVRCVEIVEEEGDKNNGRS